MMIRILRSLAFFASAFLAVPLAAAPGFPSRVVKITMPHSPGVAPSVFMRLVAEKLAKGWGQQVVVENRPGASGFIAIESMRNAAADGHELLALANSHLTINPSLYKKLPYDAERDFVPVALVLRASFFVTVAASGRYQTIPALIAAAKAEPGRISYSSSYVGSPSHLGAANFEYLTGTRMLHVPYKDQSQMYGAIANGDIDWAFSTLGSALPLLRAGRLRVIALAAKQRIASAPEVPTVEEAGGPPGFEIDSWIALVAPRGTPGDIVRRINADVAKVLAEPQVLERMSLFGFEPAPATPEEMAALIRADTRRNAEIVRRSGATVD
jgi:tripartite-type tricarboxylate transporter receptor subunit TctC